MSATLADVRKHSTSDLKYWSEISEQGLFAMTGVVLGITTTYWFRGTRGDEDAPVVGRDELYRGRPASYAGSGLKGGSLVPYPAFG